MTTEILFRWSEEGLYVEKKINKHKVKYFARLFQTFSLPLLRWNVIFRKRAESAKVLRVLALLTPMILSGVS